MNPQIAFFALFNLIPNKKIKTAFILSQLRKIYGNVNLNDYYVIKLDWETIRVTILQFAIIHQRPVLAIALIKYFACDPHFYDHNKNTYITYKLICEYHDETNMHSRKIKRYYDNGCQGTL